MTTMSEVEPIPVHVKRDDTKTASKSRVQFATFKTIQTVQNPTDPMMPHSEGRTEAVINVLGVVGTQGHVVVCDSQSMAQSLSATGEGGGMLLQPGMSIRVHWTTETWVAWLGDLLAPLVSVAQQFERGTAT
jgi:hypothetical protein